MHDWKKFENMSEPEELKTETILDEEDKSLIDKAAYALGKAGARLESKTVELAEKAREKMGGLGEEVVKGYKETRNKKKPE